MRFDNGRKISCKRNIAMNCTAYFKYETLCAVSDDSGAICKNRLLRAVGNRATSFSQIKNGGARPASDQKTCARLGRKDGAEAIENANLLNHFRARPSIRVSPTKTPFSAVIAEARFPENNPASSTNNGIETTNFAPGPPAFGLGKKLIISMR
jgi:hypothetical protein